MIMRIDSYTLGPLSTNAYLLQHEGYGLLIDPVDSADFLLEEVSRRNVTLCAMIATHGHFDHIMAAGEIQLALNVDQHFPFYIHEADMFLVKRLSQSAKYFLGYEPQVIKPHVTSFLQRGRLKIDPFYCEVIETPGHTPGGVSLYFPEQKCLFSGDTLFHHSVGRYDFSYSNKAELKQSVNKLLGLPDETVVYPGHGEDTMIGGEQKTPFLI
jgi:glyoxylase-like metal-dependent hydrolase (beta-lactamase superfamily II)